MIVDGTTAINDSTGERLIRRNGQWVPYVPEQRYESAIKKLPGAVQPFTPSTLGELGFAGGSALAAGAALAPETGGLSLLPALAPLAPVAGAAIGGFFEDPKARLKNTSYETGKAIIDQLLGGAVGKGVELGGRFLFKNRMLKKTALRVGRGLTQLFSDYPLPVPKTAEDLENQVATGQLTNAIGEKLGEFRNDLKTRIPEYSPGGPPQLQNAGPGIPFQYTTPTPPRGRKFTLPDMDANGGIVQRDLSIGDAIDHVRSLQAAGWSVAGTPKSAQEAWKIRQIAHQARQDLIAQLNRITPGLGTKYGELSGDYGASTHLQTIFQNTYRDEGGINQAHLLDQLRKEMSDIANFKGQGRALRFRTAVAPERARAIPESGLEGHLHGGLEGIRARGRLPRPFKPETRAMLPFPIRALSSRSAMPVIGLAGQLGAEDLLDQSP